MYCLAACSFADERERLRPVDPGGLAQVGGGGTRGEQDSGAGCRSSIA